jgi:transcriptional regulator with XRE-family HTH domain
MALGMTLEQLAESSRLTPNYIGTIENGKRDPSLSTVMALAKGLRVPPAELFGGLEGLSPAATEASLLFDIAPADVQDAVLKLLRSVGRRRQRASTFRQEYVAMAAGDYVISNYPAASPDFRARGEGGGSSSLSAISNTATEDRQTNNALQGIIHVVDRTRKEVRALDEDVRELMQTFNKFGSHIKTQIR